VQAKKAYRGNRITGSLILNLYFRWRLMAVLSLFLMSNESWIVIELLIRDIDTVCARNFEEVGHFCTSLFVDIHKVIMDNFLRSNMPRDGLSTPYSIVFFR
jgi:hypothetical protein